jgi:hypothetical protein
MILTTMFHLRFWRMMLLAGFFGSLMGCVGCAFLNLADEGPKFWTNNLEKRAGSGVSALDFWAGDVHWIPIVMATGFVCGFIRFITSFPGSMFCNSLVICSLKIRVVFVQRLLLVFSRKSTRITSTTLLPRELFCFPRYHCLEVPIWVLSKH